MVLQYIDGHHINVSHYTYSGKYLAKCPAVRTFLVMVFDFITSGAAETHPGLLQCGESVTMWVYWGSQSGATTIMAGTGDLVRDNPRVQWSIEETPILVRGIGFATGPNEQGSWYLSSVKGNFTFLS